MSPKELTRILKKHRIPPYYLVHPEYIMVPPDFVPSEETMLLISTYFDLMGRYQNHPLGKRGWAEQTGKSPEALEYQELRNQIGKISNGTREKVGDWLNSIGVGPFEQVYASGDDDGMTDSYHLVRVFHFLEHDAFLRITGTTDSYSGDQWDDLYQIVNPVQKTITDFEPLK
jgi:predicted Zn-dependent protease with MMP-like domain